MSCQRCSSSAAIGCRDGFTQTSNLPGLKPTMPCGNEELSGPGLCRASWPRHTARLWCRSFRRSGLPDSRLPLDLTGRRVRGEAVRALLKNSPCSPRRRVQQSGALHNPTPGGTFGLRTKNTIDLFLPLWRRFSAGTQRHLTHRSDRAHVVRQTACPPSSNRRCASCSNPPSTRNLRNQASSA